MIKEIEKVMEVVCLNEKGVHSGIIAQKKVRLPQGVDYRDQQLVIGITWRMQRGVELDTFVDGFAFQLNDIEDRLEALIMDFDAGRKSFEGVELDLFVYEVSLNARNYGFVFSFEAQFEL